VLLLLVVVLLLTLAPEADDDDGVGAEGVVPAGGVGELGFAAGGVGLKESAGLAAGGFGMLSVLLLRFSIVA